MSFKKTLLFETNVFEGNLRLDTDAIAKHCYQVRDDDVGRGVSNCGGWQSNNIFDNDKFFQQIGFIQAVREASALYARQVMGLKFTKVSISNFWININNRGDVNFKHTHPGLPVAGVFYVKVPKVINSEGAIRFIRPNSEIMARDVPEYLIDMPYNSENAGCWDFLPEENKMLVFPGWLSHQVFATNSTEDRISVSFNVHVN